MAFTCGFFNSENGDRKYNAEQMSAIFDGIIADGVFTTIGDHMAVSAGTGMQVLVGTGKAWFDHTECERRGLSLGHRCFGRDAQSYRCDRA